MLMTHVIPSLSSLIASNVHSMLIMNENKGHYQKSKNIPILLIQVFMSTLILAKILAIRKVQLAWYSSIQDFRSPQVGQNTCPG